MPESNAWWLNILGAYLVWAVPSYLKAGTLFNVDWTPFVFISFALTIVVLFFIQNALWRLWHDSKNTSIIFIRLFLICLGLAFPFLAYMCILIISMGYLSMGAIPLEASGLLLLWSSLVVALQNWVNRQQADKEKAKREVEKISGG